MEVGIDLVKKERFLNVDDYFIKRVYTKEEIDLYLTLSDLKKIDFLSSRWAIKEAIYKALGVKDYLHYSILNDENGKPFVLNHQEIKVSISHEDDYVIGIVIVDN